jgi:transposase
MFFCESQLRVFLYGQPCDMRKSFNGLTALAKNAMGHDPLSGHLFVFVNRQVNYAKVLYWSRGGYCLWAKRLERGHFAKTAVAGIAVPMTDTELMMWLDGIEMRSTVQRKRFSLSESRGSSAIMVAR